MSFKKIRINKKSSQILIIIYIFMITFSIIFLNSNLKSSPTNDGSRSLSSNEIIPLLNDDQTINITSPKEGIDKTKGYYPATYGFERDVDGEIPSGWNSPFNRIEDGMVSPEYEGHKKVLRIAHKVNRYGELYHTVGSKQMSGTIEFWMLSTARDKYVKIRFYDKDQQKLLFQVAFNQSGDIIYNSGDLWENATKYSSNTWYHIRIQFNCDTDKYSLRINDNLIEDNINFYEDDAGKGFQSINIYAIYFAPDFDIYFDAFGFSWDSNYIIGDNLIEGLLIDFETTIKLNWVGYSLDGQATQRIFRKTIIRRPNEGIHKIQIIGYDSSGTEYKSEKRYFTITPKTEIDQYSLFKTSLDDISVEKDFLKEWEGTFGVNSKRDEVIDMAIDSFGYIYAVGYTNSYSSNEFSDIVIIKYGRDSTIIWFKTWDSSYHRDDKANAIAIDSSNNIFIAGYTEVVEDTKINKDVIVIKFDSDGNKVIEKTWGEVYNESANALNVDNSDNVIITGYEDRFGPTGLNKDILLLKYQNNLEGTPKEKFWGGSDSDEAFDISTDQYENIYLTGYTESSGLGKDIVLLKYSESIGDPLFTKYWGGINDDTASSMTIDYNTNSIFITGATNSYGNGLSDLLILKYNFTGTFQWYKTWGTSENEYGNDISFDPSGFLYITGNEDNFLLEFSDNGNFIWHKNHSINEWEDSSSIVIDSTNYYQGGNIIYVGGIVDNNIYLQKYNILNGYVPIIQGNERRERDLLFHRVSGIDSDSDNPEVSAIADVGWSKFSDDNKIFELRIKDFGKQYDPLMSSYYIQAYSWIITNPIDYWEYSDLAYEDIKFEIDFTMKGDFTQIYSQVWPNIVYVTTYLIGMGGAPDIILNDHLSLFSDTYYVGNEDITIRLSDLMDPNYDISDYISYKGELNIRIETRIYGADDSPIPSKYIEGILELDKLNVILEEKQKINSQIGFSVKKNHVITNNSNLYLSLSNFLNPYDENTLTIITGTGLFYTQIDLPRKDSPMDIKIEIPIYLDKLSTKCRADGCIYDENLMIFAPNTSFEVSSFNINMEDLFTQAVFLKFDDIYGYIDFGLDVSTYIGTAWKGSKVIVHMPKSQELCDYYGFNVYYDQLWSFNKVGFSYEDNPYELNLSFSIDHETHLFFINDTDIEAGDITQSLNPFTYRMYFNKKPLAMNLFIQKPNLELGHEIIQTNESDYEEYLLYCKVYDPNPVLNITDIPYFLASAIYQPRIKYIIAGSDVTYGINFMNGINIEPFIFNLDPGKYAYQSFLENAFESVYDTSILDENHLEFYEQPILNITPLFDEPIMIDSGFPFSVELFSPDGVELVKDIKVRAEKSYWDAHDNISSNLNIFANYSGKVYHFETGMPSSSMNLTNNQPFYTLLNNLTYPDNSLIVAPEILEFNPTTNYTRQQIEIFIQLDLTDIIKNHNLDPSKDFSFFNATMFGSSFIDTSQKIEDIILSYGELQIHNSVTDQYHTLLPDNLFYQTLEQGNPNNPLKLEDLNEYSRWLANGSIGKYINPQNKIEFKITSYFEGIVSAPNNTYFSTFDNPNAVLGALLDYVHFDITWWKKSPELFNITEAENITAWGEDYILQTCPGIYSVSFEFSGPYYIDVLKKIKINATRRPTKIDLEVPLEGYSTGNVILKANVIDQATGGPARDAKVLYHSEYNETDIILGESLANIDGIATLTLSNLPLGNHSIWAEIMISDGRHVKPFEDERFYGDKWAVNYSANFTLQMHLSQSSLELISLAPEKKDVVVNQSFYIYPRLMDTYTGKEVPHKLIDVHVNSTYMGSFYSANPFLINFTEPGRFIVEAFYKGTPILNESQYSTLFNAKRLSLSIINKTPAGPLYFPNQLINLTILARDLATNTPISNLPISLYHNLTDIPLANGITNMEGKIIFTVEIAEDWVLISKDLHFYAISDQIPHLYLSQHSNEVPIELSPFHCNISLNINETQLFANEMYNFTFNLWNIDLEEFINEELIIFTIFKEYPDTIPEYTNIEVITSINNSLILNFSEARSFEIWVKHEETNLYSYCLDIFAIEVQKHPTFISINVTEKNLVPGNNYSITVNLIDALTNQTILNEIVDVFENIYDNGSLIMSKDPFKINTQYTNTFMWIPLRAADFEFIFTYDFSLYDSIYQTSNYSTILNVKKRQVWIDSQINSTTFKVGDTIQINSTFNDLNTTNLDPISGLLVHHLIHDGEYILHSENLTSDDQGVINFEWDIPLSQINKTLKILIITADTNFYQWNYRKFEISTLPLDTFFNITIQPSTINFVNMDSIFNIELLTIQGDKIKVNVSYEISCDEISYLEKGIMNLKESNILNIAFSEAGRYEIAFSYNGSNIYAPTSLEKTYYIELRPSSLEIMDFPEFIYISQQIVSLTYKLVDAFSQIPIAGSLVKLYYIDQDLFTRVFLGLQDITDVNGMVSFLVEMPENYNFDSIIFLAEANDTVFNNGSGNSVEILITPGPTFINFKTPTYSFQYYIGDSLNITIELFDYYGNLLISKSLSIEIETPSENISKTISNNQSITLNFTHLGPYRINASFVGNNDYLPSSSQVIYAASPIPTSLEFVEPIPETIHVSQFLNLKAQLKNNLTQSLIEGELVKFYIANETIVHLIYNGTTDENGFISHSWEVDSLFVDQDVRIHAEYEYTYNYENSSTPKISTHVSKYDIELILIEFPEILSPLTEVSFNVKAIRVDTGDVADSCHLQVFLLYPNNTRELIEEGITNVDGKLVFNWQPHRSIFDYNEIRIEIQVVEDDIYYGGLMISKEVPIEKIKTFISIIPEKIQILPNETISIHFKLFNFYNEPLTGELIEVEIHNVFYSINFTIQVGVNDTYEFYVPTYGIFEIIGKYKGSERNHASLNSTRIYSSKIELEIKLSVLESFTKNITCGFLGSYWNFSILDYHKNFTLIANVTIKGYDIPAEGVEVSFYFKQHFKDTILIGSNMTNSKGIAVYKWDTINYTMPYWWSSSALLAKVEKDDIYEESTSDPVYITLRKIFTFISLKTFTSKFRINVDYRINITLYDEFGFKLNGYNLTVKVYDPEGNLVQTFNIMTNESAHIPITPTKLGYYKIKAYFLGAEQCRKATKIKLYKCIEKEPTSINILVPALIEPERPYNLTIELINSTGGLLMGELVEVSIMYHDDSGKTQFLCIQVIMGINNSFEWVFPEYDEYIIKAIYAGSDDHGASSSIKLSSMLAIFRFNIWEIFFFFLFIPCVMIPVSEKKISSRQGKKKRSSGYSKKKKYFMALVLILVIFGSTYAGISFSCSQTKTTGLIGDMDCISNYKPENPLFKGQNQEIMNDLLGYGTSKLQGLTSNMNPEWIPNLVNKTSPYDMIVQNSSIIPPEADKTPPYLRFINIREGQSINGLFPIEVGALDRESGINKVFFILLNKSLNIIEEGEFIYNESRDIFIHDLNTLNYNDGEHVIYIIAYDNNDNNQTISANIEILNHPTYDPEYIEFDYILVELTDYINVTFTSLVDGQYNIEIRSYKNDDVHWYAGDIDKYEIISLKIPITPLYFQEGDYKIKITIFALVFIGPIATYKTETQELDLKIIKESVKLELDVLEGDKIYSDHQITFRARLFENDWIGTEGEMKESEEINPIAGQVLTFEISDSDNYKNLGTAITDSDGYATFTYKVDLFKGLHIFNVSFQGNNIYKSLESMKLFENQGIFTFINLHDVNTPIAYNRFGIISAQLFDDPILLPNQILYFNISNPLENRYLGMATTDSNGIATIEFPCNYLPGLYDIIVYYDGDSFYSKNISVFKDAFEIIKEDTSVSIITGHGSTINCPYYYDTELVVKLVVDETNIGIEGIPVNFELIDNTLPHIIGTSYTDLNGFASITFNPSNYYFTPDTYLFNVYNDENNYYKASDDYVNLNILKDVPIINIEGTDAYFKEEFQISATLIDSLLNPLIGKELHFNTVDKSTNNPIDLGSAITNENGVATLLIASDAFNYYGTFDIEVRFSGDEFEKETSCKVENALNILSRETQLYITGPKEETPLEPLDIEILLTDNRGTLIRNQPIFLECFRENGMTNLLSNRIILTDDISGRATFSLPLLLPGKYIIHAYYQPQLDIDPLNDGFLESQAEFNFSIVRIPAALSIEKVNLPRIMRGDVLEFTVVSRSEAAKDFIIPIRLYVNLDIDGDGIAHDDALGEVRAIYDGKGAISYEIPRDPLYQAGIYNFSIEIEEGTFFKGSTWILIDLVERTTLSINYDILNPRAEGKHYIWEPERIRFILLDEDGTPLPETCGSETDYEIVNRLIHYQIINGKNVYGVEETSLESGTFSIIHEPDSYGFETCSAFYEGSRFFAPADQKRKAEIFRRPLILHFLNYYHDNPERLDLPHSGHRGENITIKARVQDYLNLSCLKGHDMFFGYNGKYLDISNTSNEDGNVTITVPLTAENGLIQAGLYNLSIKIYLSEKFETAETFHPIILRIFENCSIKFMVYKFSTDKYVYRPKILFFDEDNQLLSSIPFYVQVINKESKNIVFFGDIKSGKLDLSFTEGGTYEIQGRLDDSEKALSEKISDLAEYYLNLTNFLVFITSIDFSVTDEFIESFDLLEFLSESIANALWVGINIGARPLTIAILFSAYLICGPQEQKIKYTYGMYIKYLLIMLILDILNSKAPSLSGALPSGKILGVAVKGKIITTENIKSYIKEAIYVRGIESGILFLYGMVLTLKNKFKKAGSDGLAWFCTRIMAAILGAWVAFHIIHALFKEVPREVFSNSDLIIIYLIIIFIYIVVDLFVEPLADFIAYDLIPKSNIPFIENILKTIRRAIYLGLVYSISLGIIIATLHFVFIGTSLISIIIKIMIQQIVNVLIAQSTVILVTFLLVLAGVEQQY